MTREELLNKIAIKNAQGEWGDFQSNRKSYFFNGKRIKLKKLINIIFNNHHVDMVYELKMSIRSLGRSKGDYNYFSISYGGGTLKKHRFYIMASRS